MVYPFSKRIVAPLVRLWMRRISGLENFPEKEGFILACNHGSFYDDLAMHSILLLKLDKYVHIYVNSKFFKNWFFRIVLRWGKCIPVDVDKKKHGKTNEKAFKYAVKYLKKGDMVGIFPEGHRSYPDRMRPGKTGVAKLALSAKVPVVPMGIDGSRKVLPFKSKMIQLKRCDVNIGKPMYFDKYYGKENDRKVLKEITDKVMKKISKLANERYEY